MSRFLSRFLLFLVLVASTAPGRTPAAIPARAQQDPGTYDKNAASIKATPSRLMLGSLPYGLKADSVLTRGVTLMGFPHGTSLTTIDFSHAEGIQLLSRNAVPDGIGLTFAISVIHFSRDQPYGKFIKKIIRIETDSDQQPQILIPVIGWLGVNETPRDFNTFIFNGSQRWQGWWSTPNVAASVLAPLAVFFIGALAWVWTNQRCALRWLNLGIIGLLLVTILSLLIFLAFTYSRGAWTALVVGCLILTAQSGQLRRNGLLALCAFGLILVLLPSGLNRVGSYTHIEADLSVANRLKLWTGALQIMAEHPLIGVGSDQFGSVFERDYQRFDHTAQNSTAVSDFFTFGAEHGLLLLGICLGLLLFLCAESMRAALRNRSVLQLTLAAMLATILVASAFSTLWFVREYEWIFGAAIVGLLACRARQVWRGKKRKSQVLSLLVGAAIFTTVTLVLCALVSGASLSLLPTKTRDLTVRPANQEPLQCSVVEPRWKKSNGVIVYFSDTDEDTNLLFHSTLRPLSALGWQVIWAPDSTDPTQAEALVTAVSRAFKGQKLYVAGDGQGGRTAWQVAVARPDIVTAGGGFGFLTEDLDSTPGTPTLQRPFLVCHSLYDDHVSPNAAIRAQQKKAFSGLPLKIILVPDSVSRFSLDWMEWIEQVNIYSQSK